MNGRYRADRELQVRARLDQQWLAFLAALGSHAQSLLGVGTAAEQLICVRALEAACFRFGLLLRMPRPCATAWPVLPGVAGLDNPSVVRLKTLWMPQAAAAVALSLFLGNGAEQLAQLRVGQLVAGASTWSEDP